MPKLLISGRGGEQVHTFENREVVLGCDAACDIVVQGSEVSPEHCKIQPVMGAWKIVDLESDAGTRVNGAYVNQRPLRTGDVLELGDVRMVFQDEAPAAAPAGRTAAVPAATGTSSRRAGGRRAAARAAPAARSGGRRGGRSTRRRDDAEPEQERERPARRRRRSSNSGMTVLLVIGALIVLAGGGYLVLKPSTSPNEKVFMRMRQAEEAMDWQAVLREAQAGNVNDPEFGSRIADLEARAEKQVQMDGAREKLVEGTNAWNRIVLWRQDDNWKNDAEYVQRIDAFLAEYGRYGGPSVDLAHQARAKITGVAEAGSAGSAGAAWAQLQSNVNALKGNGQFGQALQGCDDFVAKWGSQDRGLANQANDLKTKLRSDAGKWMGLQISRAQHKVDQGTKLQARKILEKAAEVIGIRSFEERAAQALVEITQ